MKTVERKSRWESKRTAETRRIEDLLRTNFARVDSYRYNSASIRIRVIDEKFEGMSRDKRDSRVETLLKTLPLRTQSDIVTLLTFAPSELTDARKSTREAVLNAEFECPSPSRL